MQDHTRLKVFALADQLAEEVYRVTRAMPPDEKTGMQAELRRAALRVPVSIVEGCARASSAELLAALTAALAAATELRYLLGLSVRLGLLPVSEGSALDPRCAELLRSLQSLIESLGRS